MAMSKPAAKRGGGRPIGPLMKKIKHFDRPSKRKLIETDADQLRIKREIDERYAGVPDMGRVIPKGSEEFKRIAAGLLARENAGVADMAVKFCTVAGCKKMAQHGCEGMCKAHFGAAQREAGAVVKPGHAYALEPGEVIFTPDPPARITNSVDPLVVSALREVFAEKEAEWVARLSGLKRSQAICRMAGMVEALGALEELGR